jgi:hypothetical protein
MNQVMSRKEFRADMAPSTAITPSTNTVNLNIQPINSSIPSDIYIKYRDILNNKKEMKRKLKKFDEDFLEKFGRNPRKADKEVCKIILLF